MPSHSPSPYTSESSGLFYSKTSAGSLAKNLLAGGARESTTSYKHAPHKRLCPPKFLAFGLAGVLIFASPNAALAQADSAAFTSSGANTSPQSAPTPASGSSTENPSQPSSNKDTEKKSQLKETLTEDYSSGWHYEIELKNTMTYSKQIFPSSGPIVFSPTYQRQDYYLIDPTYRVTAAYQKDIFKVKKSTSSVDFEIRGLIRGLPQPISLPPIVRLTATPLQGELPNYSLNLGTLGLNDKILDLGLLEYRGEIYGETGVDFQFKNHPLGAELYAHHIFNPLGLVPVLWKKAVFRGQSDHVLYLKQNLQNPTSSPLATPAHLLSAGLITKYKGNLVALLMNNIIANSNIEITKLSSQLFDNTRESYAMLQYVQLYYRFIPWRLISDIKFYRVPFPIRNQGKYFKTHGFFISHSLTLNF